MLAVLVEQVGLAGPIGVLLVAALSLLAVSAEYAVHTLFLIG